MNLNALANFPDNTETTDEFTDIKTIGELMDAIKDFIADCEGRASSFMFTVTKGKDNDSES